MLVTTFVSRGAWGLEGWGTIITLEEQLENVDTTSNGVSNQNV
jgi:hypothetical protein